MCIKSNVLWFSFCAFELNPVVVRVALSLKRRENETQSVTKAETIYRHFVVNVVY